MCKSTEVSSGNWKWFSFIREELWGRERAWRGRARAGTLGSAEVPGCALGQVTIQGTLRTQGSARFLFCKDSFCGRGVEHGEARGRDLGELRRETVKSKLVKIMTPALNCFLMVLTSRFPHLVFLLLPSAPQPHVWFKQGGSVGS